MDLMKIMQFDNYYHLALGKITIFQYYQNEVTFAKRLGAFKNIEVTND